jgi:hypothetical protein
MKLLLRMFRDCFKVLNSGRGSVKDFAISTITDIVLRIAVVAMWINHNITQTFIKIISTMIYV